MRSLDSFEEHGGHYIPGWRLVDPPGQNLAHSKLVEMSSAVLTYIVDKIGETVILSGPVVRKAMCLRQIEWPKPIRYAFRFNQLVPLHAGPANASY